MSEKVVIETTDLSFSYDERPVLSDVNVSIRKGDFVSIVGPNGGGKTTLLELFMGLHRPASGKVLILNQPPEKMRSKIGYMPQHMSFDWDFPVSVLDVVLMGRLAGNWNPLFYKKADKQLALCALCEVGLEEKAGEKFSKLSGGQKQRTLIARALVSGPEMLLLDEPTSNLDYVVNERFYELLRHLNEKMTILIVSHDVGFVSRFVDRVVCVNQKVIEHPMMEIEDEGLNNLYGSEMKFVRHDLSKSGEKDPCKGF